MRDADRGVDGHLLFLDEADKRAQKVVVQARSGHVQSGHIRHLRVVVGHEQAALGFLITLERLGQLILTEPLSAAGA